MIVLDQRECALRCSICEELDGISARAMDNEAALAVLTAAMATAHAGCERFAHNPARAKAERVFDRRMAAAMRGTSCGL